MPIFEYRCSSCDTHFETLVRGSEAPTCPSCHGEELVRQLSTFAVRGPSASASPLPAGPCGTCGDPRGAGSCSLN